LYLSQHSERAVDGNKLTIFFGDAGRLTGAMMEGG